MVTAVADEAVVEEATQAVRLADAVSGTVDPAAVEVSDEGSTRARTISGATVTVPADPAEGVGLDTPGGASIEMSVLGATARRMP